MVLINEFDTAKVLTVNSIQIKNSRKNIYKNAVGDVVDEIVISGNITLNCSIEYENKTELVNKLNEVEQYLASGHLEIDEVVYDVRLLKGLDPSSDFGNFNLVFSWDGQIVEDGVKKYIC